MSESELPIPRVEFLAKILLGRGTADMYGAAKRHYESQPTRSYDAARNASFYAYKMVGSDLRLAVAAAYKFSNELSRKDNVEIVRLVGKCAEGRVLDCYPLGRRPLTITTELAIPVESPFYFIENGRPLVFWPQCWKSELSLRALGFIAFALKSVFIDGDYDFSGGDVEIVDLSAPPGSNKRRKKIYHLMDVSLPTKSEFDGLVQDFLAVRERLMRDGVVQRKRKRRPDPNQAPLF